MKYISIDKDTFIQFDPDTSKSTVLKKSQLLAEKEQIEQELNSYPSDEELLKWAKENYTISENKRYQMDARRIAIDEILNNI